MKKAISVIAFVVLIGACKKKTSETVTNIDTVTNQSINNSLGKDYYLIKKIEQKEFPMGKSFKLEGTLKDQNLKTDFKNIELVLQDSANNIIRRATVRPDGKFAFFKVESNSYKLSIDTATMMSILDKIKITKTEDFVKDDAVDAYVVGKKVPVGSLATRLLTTIYKDSLVKNNATKISGTLTSTNILPKILTYLLIDPTNTIIRRVEWASKDALSFSQLYPKNYRILSLDPIQGGASMKLKYIPNVQKEIANVENYKLGDVVDAKKLSKYTSYSFSADTLQDNSFKGILTKNGEAEDEGKLLLLNNQNKVVHELATNQMGSFNFDNLEPKETFKIVAVSKEKGLRILHTNPKAKVPAMDHLDSLEQQLLQPRSMKEVLSQNNTPIILDKNKVDEVLGRIDAKISKDNNDAELYYKKGVLQQEEGDYNGSINSFEKSIEIKQDYSQAYYMLGESRDYMGDYEGAVQAYGKCIQYEPTNMAAYYKRGLVRKDIDEEIEANEDLTKVINAFPTYHYPYFYRGLARIKAERYSEAIFDFDKALSIEPNLPEAYFNKGYANIVRNNPKDALENLKKALSLKPDDANTYLLLGQANSMTQKPAEAIKNFDQAISLNPDLEIAYYEKAAVMFTQGDEANAHKMYDEAITKFNSEYEPYYQRGVFYYNIKSYKSAKDDLDKAATINQEDPYIFYYRALVNKELKNKSEICPDLEMATKLGYVDGDQSMKKLKDKYCK